jgi:hypothetical protein
MRMMIAMAVAVTGKVGGTESRQEPGGISMVYTG